MWAGLARHLAFKKMMQAHVLNFDLVMCCPWAR
jgi:hypothetical protein